MGTYNAMRQAMQRFVDRVDAGEVRSKRTYAEFKEILSAAPAAPESERAKVVMPEWPGEGWNPMETAPRDGTMLRLLVDFTDHATEDSDRAPTIGSNSFDNTGEDEWQFAGWSWSQDCYTQGEGTPVGWLPMLDKEHHDRAAAPAPVAGDAVAKLPAKWREDVRTKYGQGPSGSALLHCAAALEAALAQDRTNRSNLEQSNPCKCTDCGGDQPNHSPDCTYMNELYGKGD